MQLLAATVPVALAQVPRDGPPLVVARNALSAQPAEFSVGPAGPFNRWAFDVERFDPDAGSAQVTCFYGTGFAYRCDAAIASPRGAGGRRRVTVTIPDLGRGGEVTVRFATPQGVHDVVVEVANTPRVVHEIEALALAGGKVVTGTDGRPQPSDQLVRAQATSTPAMATSSLGLAPACDRLYALWAGATVTDAVFSGPLGRLEGSITAWKPVVPGSRVAPDNLPEWLVTYPLGANRVQFIAHYEVIYRVGTCEERRLSEGSRQGANAPPHSTPRPLPAVA